MENLGNELIIEIKCIQCMFKSQNRRECIIGILNININMTYYRNDLIKKY